MVGKFLFWWSTRVCTALQDDTGYFSQKFSSTILKNLPFELSRSMKAVDHCRNLECFQIQVM